MCLCGFSQAPARALQNHRAFARLCGRSRRNRSRLISWQNSSSSRVQVVKLPAKQNARVHPPKMRSPASMPDPGQSANAFHPNDTLQDTAGFLAPVYLVKPCLALIPIGLVAINFDILTARRSITLEPMGRATWRARAVVPAWKGTGRAMPCKRENRRTILGPAATRRRRLPHTSPPP